MSPSATRVPFPVTVYPFRSPTPGSCAYERGSSSAKNALVFLPGLTSGPHATDLNFLANMLEQSPSLDYALWEFRMRSSYSGFGYSSLAHDVEDMTALIQYLRAIGKEKIVLMGSSTGCQNCLEYTDRIKYKTPSVDGYILTSPVSDREAAFLFMSPGELDKSVRVAVDMIYDGKKDQPMAQEHLPFIFTTPVTAYRWHSLSAKSGDDDYFSSDLPDSTLAAKFGRVDKPLLFLPAGDDEMVPPTVDRKALLGRWISACRPGVASELSGFIPEADHVVSRPEAQAWLAERVGGFLREI
ncbi:DUF1749-domain-containing protein [Parathielavia appendiculata]|uniref:DUF1749-domain-containing protein n=1 Tax=Parathielavia appendiculata TaxID=2587402 RepID=A0AAN6UBY5_9PEZI|nr:DUF1749-domain-containing protein [Parathielavia appendiculata]